MLKPLNIVLCALFNRARGSHFGELVNSTGFCHIFGPMFMALSVATSWQSFLTIWAGLIFWAIWAWDAYWGACSGNEKDRFRSAVKPIDWILKKLNFKNIRVHGVVGMGLRQGLCALPLFFLHPSPLFFLIFLAGIPYWLYSLKSQNFVMLSELTIGAIWGLIL